MADLTAEIPKPLRLALFLASGACVPFVILVLAASLVGHAALVGPLAAPELWPMWLPGDPAPWIVAVVPGIFLLLVLSTIGRVAPLYRAIVRAPTERRDGPPPSTAAVRDAFRAPGRVVAIAAKVVFLLLALWIGLASVSAPVWWVLGSAMIPAAGTVLALQAIEIIWRRVLRDWLQRVLATDVELAMQASLRRRVLLAGLLPTFGLVLLALGLSLRLHPPPSIAAFTLSLASVLALGLVLVGGARLGSAATHDLAHLKAWVQRATDDESSDLAAAATLRSEPGRRLLVACRTRGGVRLAGRLGDLNQRHNELISAQLEATHAVEQAQQLKTRFMAYMSHDLRSPLNSLIGFTQVLSQGGDGDLNEQQHESLDLIRDSAAELLLLVSDILDSAQLEAGRLGLERAWTPCAEVVSMAISYARERGGREGLQVDARLSAGLPPLFVDRDRLVQALGSVLIHLSRLAAGRGELGLQVSRTVDSVLFRAEAAQAGLRDVDRQQLFAAFREMREQGGTRLGGLGLGLSLARDLVRLHGGDLRCEQGAEHGIEFELAMPFASDAT